MKAIYQTRREDFMHSDSCPYLTILYSGKAPVRSADETYRFSVERNFYYMTGIDLENAVLVMIRESDTKVYSNLYLNLRDEETAKWIGGSPSSEELKRFSGIEHIYPINLWKSHIHRYLCSHSFRPSVGLNLWRCRFDDEPTQAHQLSSWIRTMYPEAKIQNIFPSLAKARLIKSDDELEKMKIAQDTTKNALEELYAYVRPEMNECEIEGIFDFSLRKQGVKETAFPSIVAGGMRATTLHYSENNHLVHDNELVLLDLGSTHQHYCADISRTFPINGKFTERQKQLYNIVLEAQNRVIEAAVPGITLLELNDIVIEYYQTALKEIGLLENGKSVKDYYYHGVSHPLGLDTHDISLPELEKLVPGMVITVEPGLYVTEEGIGIRIEDDILITTDSAVNLSSNIAKKPEDIELLMSKSLI